MQTQDEEIIKLVQSIPNQNFEVRDRFLKRAQEGNISKDNNEHSHFCIYFLPYNSAIKKVFIIHHKKSGLWISPGGHIDNNEHLLKALNRELMEELGMINFFPELPKPFLLTITPINNGMLPCKEHFDIWFLIPTNGEEFKLDMQEFYDAKWLSIEEAKKIVTNEQNLVALDIVHDDY